MKTYGPITPGMRQAERFDTAPLTRAKPQRSLVIGFSRGTGRNSQGRITTRHKGGGVKRRYRLIDFRYDKKDVPGVVEAVEYDPNRTTFIALVRYADGERRYVLAPQGTAPGSRFVVSERASVETGNRLPLARIPVGTTVCNVELVPGRGAALVRSAGSSAQVLAIEGNRAQLKLPSGEVRIVDARGWATIGALSNPEWAFMTVGKAGRMRRRGVRPTVRGSAMNPRDHPYGGGEGRQLRGTRRPKTAWGKVTGGVRTRRSTRTDRLIIQRRSR